MMSMLMIVKWFSMLIIEYWGESCIFRRSDLSVFPAPHGALRATVRGVLGPDRGHREATRGPRLGIIAPAPRYNLPPWAMKRHVAAIWSCKFG